MLRYILMATTVFALSAPVGTAAAQEPKADGKAPEGAAGKPAEKPPKDAAKPTPLKATVVSVEGIAQKRLASDPKGRWETIEVGDVLGELTLIRTGLGTKVVLKFADRGNVTVKSATKIGIGEFRKRGELVTMRVGLKYGAMRARVDSARGPNDFRVKTPVATLSVRGSGGRFGFSEMGLGAHSTEHTWRVFGQGNRVMNLGEGESTDGNLTHSAELASTLRDTQMSDPHDYSDAVAARNLRNNGGGSGIIGFAGNSNVGSAGSTDTSTGGSVVSKPVDTVPSAVPSRDNEIIVDYPDL